MGKQKSNDAAVKRKNRRLTDTLSELEQNYHEVTDALSAARGNGLSAEKLKSEINFLRYIDMLKKFAQRYCVIIVANDTPYGPSVTPEMTERLMDIGLHINLFGRYRCAYAALIDAGTLVFEEIRLDTAEFIEKKIDLDGNKFVLTSVGFNGARHLPTGSILINGTEYAPNQRGLNVVVYDKVTQVLLDAIAFDMFSENIDGFRTDSIFMMKDYAERHRDVSVMCMQLPPFPDESFTAGEKYISDNKFRFTEMLLNPDRQDYILNQYYDKKGMIEVLKTPPSYHDMYGVRRFEDVHGKHVNTSGGHRVTAYQPAQFQRTIYLVGGCITFGVGSEDRCTIASYLQAMFNVKCPDSGVIVQNYGYFLCERDRKGDDLEKILNALPVKPGDMVICHAQDASKFGVPCIDLSKIAMVPRTYEVFFDWGHYTPDGNRLIADGLFRALTESGTAFDTNTSVRGGGQHKTSRIVTDLTAVPLKN